MKNEFFYYFEYRDLAIAILVERHDDGCYAYQSCFVDNDQYGECYASSFPTLLFALFDAVNALPRFCKDWGAYDA